jgi:hypothetical protein
MCFYRRNLFLLITLASANAAAEGYVVGVGAEGDSADGRAITAFGDFGVGEKTWLSVTAMSGKTDGLIRSNETLYAGAGLDHWFKPFGIRFGASYWGNSDILDSRDLQSSLYVRGNAGSISLEHDRRDFKFRLQSDALRGRTAEFSADGWGLRARVALGDRLNFTLGGMTYDYSRNLRLQPDIDALAYLSSSRLSMINSLIDHRFSGGFELEFGLRSVDVTAGNWQLAVDGSVVDSYSIGFLTPISDRVDMEMRLAFDDSETFGRTTAVSVHLYYFGGS